MADTIVRTFSLLVETDQKLERLAKETFRRNKGDVIDFAVAELWRRNYPEADSDSCPVSPPVEMT